MKFSENWLRQHVSIDADSAALERKLTMIGLEVEGTERIGERLDGVVVARIIECARHPDAERLQVCKVDAGDRGLLQIVCGAPNARAGLVAPLATVGARVGDIEIKAAKLRGVESSGMLCSAKELGLDADASGLFELPADAPVGAPLAQYLGLPDTVFELGLTPNRGDCFSIRGIAYDVAAAFGTQVKPLEAAPVPAASDARPDVVRVDIRLDAGAAAPRYCGRVIEGIDATRPSPAWMVERLRRSGIRPVSLLVDITQYVMLELGQPMHAYDRDLLRGTIGVRSAHAGETLRLLNGDDAELDAKFLVITDAAAPGESRAVGLGGIMGGDDTKVGATTRNVFLEAAHFAPEAIIGRSRRLGLHTDAAHRFERGVDPEMPRTAIEAATRLVVDLAGGKPGPVLEARIEGEPARRAAVTLRRARLARVLGIAIADADVARILASLGLDATATADGWQVVPPPRRFDIAIEEDLIEEVARIHGYDAIPATLPGGAARLAAPSEARVGEDAARAQLAARDFLDTINYAFVDAALLATWHLDAGSVVLANPLSAELGVMRTALLPGLTQALARNVARQQPRVRLSELGKVFHAAGTGEPPRETARVAAVACGAAHAEQWGVSTRAMDFQDLKGDLESLAALSGARLAFRPSAAPWGHPGRSADVLRVDGGAGVALGWIGQLHPRLQRALDLDVDAWGFELDLVPLLARPLPRAQALSRFPSVRRDLAFVVASGVPWAAVAATVEAAAGPTLRELRLFDVYAGKGVESGFKSFAMALILQDESRTLTDRDVDAVVAAASAALAQEHGATIRS